MKQTILLFIFSFLAFQCMAQNFKGRVTDGKGNPVSYASLYLRDTKSGFTTDNNGCFQTTLLPGQYTCEVSSIGFIAQIFSFQMSDKDLEKNLVLAEQVYALDEVNIVRGNENPAYPIMRQAIARAPYFRTHVKGFTAGTYLKGTGKITAIPAILKLSKEVRKESKDVLGKLFVLEEQREVTFKAPNTWNNRVKAYRNSFPENFQVNINMNTINLYEPDVFGKASPLGRNAFTYYDFKWDGCYTEGGHVINKIKVIPKKDNSRLLTGSLYIVEDLWCVAAAQLSFRNSGMKASVKVTCKEVQPSVFLSTSTSMTAHVDLLGMKMEASYLAAAHYTKVEVGNWHPETATVQKNAVSKKVEKLNRQIEELTSKDDLTLGDVYKLSKLMEKTIKETDTLRSKRKYELPSHTYGAKKQTDSLAGKKDSLYWASARSVPLRLEEQQSYIDKEKKIALKDSIPGREKKQKTLASKVFETFVVGHTFRTHNKKAWVALSGLTSYIPQYNFVDGFWIGAKVKTGIKLSETTELQFIPSAYYTSARKTWVGQGELLLNYAPKRQGQFAFSGGSLSSDYNEETGESVLINSLSTSLFARNDIKFFDKQFLTVSHQIELTNSLLFSASLTWQKRKILGNHISQSWFKKKAEPNIPNAVSFQSMPENKILKVSFGLEYTPAHYYRMAQGKKIYEDSRYPTFSINYDRAFPLKEKIVSPSYHSMMFSAHQKIEFGMFNNLYWSVNAGTFWDKSRMQFPDFYHFSATKFPITGRSFNEGFSLLDNYAYSTADRWAQVNLSWYTPYLLIKHLPFLKKKLFDEALHLRSLVTYGNQPYTEIGYSVGFLTIGRLGVFVGFERLKYRSVGVSVSLPLTTFIRH